MDQKQREAKIEKLTIQLNKLYDKADALEDQLRELENSRQCDLCGSQYKLFNSNGSCGGTDFTFSELEPILCEGKLVTCICARCLRKKWDEVYETH